MALPETGTSLLDVRRQDNASTQAVPQPRRAPRLALLDGLRFLAAVLVLLYHYTAWHHEFWGTSVAKDAWPGLSRFTMYGNMGVQLFFIISGFVILLSAYGKSASRFVGSRVGRLYPAYWVAVLATGFLVIVLWPALGDGRGMKELLANLTMFHPAMGLRHIDGVYWTLWVELRFYMVILVLIMLRMLTIRLVTVFAAAWPLLGLVCQLAGSEYAANWLMAEYAPLFAGGMMLFVIYRFGHSVKRWAILLLNVVLSAYFTGLKAPVEAMELVGYDVAPWTYWVIVAGMFATVAALSLTPLRNIQWRFLALAGALTYPVYLLHQVWGWWLIDRLNPVLGQYLTLPVVMGVVFIAAYLVHRFVERPLAKPLATGTTMCLDYVGAWGRKLLSPVLQRR